MQRIVSHASYTIVAVTLAWLWTTPWPRYMRTFAPTHGMAPSTADHSALGSITAALLLLLTDLDVQIENDGEDDRTRISKHLPRIASCTLKYLLRST